MKRFLVLMILTLALSGAAFAQKHGEPGHKHEESEGLNSKGQPVVKSKDNAPVELKDGEKITRGAALAKGVKTVKLDKVMKDPTKYADQTIAVEGLIVKSCKKEGCWMEMGDKNGKNSVRVTFGDHLFFIPLNAAGFKVKAQGQFKTQTHSKEHFDHLVKDDGADPTKFKINADGSATEVSFDATGVEMSKVLK